MSDHKGVCEATGVENWQWNKYAGQARIYLREGQAPRIVSQAELEGAIEFVANNPDEICESADGRARAALVLGYVASVKSIDQRIPADEVRDVVIRDYASFRHLIPLTTESGFNGSVLRFANDVRDVTGYYYCDHRYNDPPTPEQETTLRGVLQQVRDLKRQGKRPVVVLDVDDTLSDPSVREHRLLNEHLNAFVQANPGALTPEEFARIRAIRPEQLSYNVALDLQVTFGIQNEVFLKAWTPYFLSHFFRSDYCQEDTPYPGAAEYVRELAKAGATVVYFTGRHEKGKLPGTEEGMRAGTVEFFRRHNFPLPNNKNVFLLMKPNFEDDDMEYKGQALARIKAMGTLVAAFDNEPVAGGMFTEAGFANVVDIGMCQAPFYKGSIKRDGKKIPITTLQDIPFEPETVVRINDFRLNHKGAAVVGQQPSVSPVVRAEP